MTNIERCKIVSDISKTIEDCRQCVTDCDVIMNELKSNINILETQDVGLVLAGLSCNNHMVWLYLNHIEHLLETLAAEV